VLYGTGIRLSELVALDIRDVDYSNEYIKVLGKGSKERIVPIGEYALKSIEYYCANSRAKLLNKVTKKHYLLIQGEIEFHLGEFNIFRTVQPTLGDSQKYFSPHISSHFCNSSFR